MIFFYGNNFPVLSSLQEELSQSCQRVQVLERYLGGEVPPEGRGVTWREEREGLIARVQVGWRGGAHRKS